MRPTISPTSTSRVTAVEFTQTFTGVDADKCSVAVPYIQSSTAESLAVDLNAVIVTPGAGCTDSYTGRRRIQEGVEFVIQVIYESEADKTEIEAILNETLYTENFTVSFAAAISGTEDAELFSSVISISIAERVTVEIDAPVTTTIIETTLEVIETVKAGDENTSIVLIVGIVVPLFIIFLGIIVMWYFGYFKEIRKYMTGGKNFRGPKKRRTKNERAFDYIGDIAPDSSENEEEKLEMNIISV